jgi:hypothetical protein
MLTGPGCLAALGAKPTSHLVSGGSSESAHEAGRLVAWPRAAPATIASQPA